MTREVLADPIVLKKISVYWKKKVPLVVLAPEIS
jgi:hypothetical protein